MSVEIDTAGGSRDRIPRWTVRADGLAWPILIFVVAYLTLFTRDLRLGALPLKVPLVALALSVWWLECGRRRDLADFRLARPVYALGVFVPVIWSLVAIVTKLIGSDVAVISYGDILQEASRFGYVLLYFPLVDLLRNADDRRHGGWLWPVLALAVITWLLWAGEALADLGYQDRSTVLAFSGIFSEQDGAFRVFIANQILFAPALGLLLARALRVRWSWAIACALLLLVSAAYHAHTRGLWMALLTVAAVVVLFQWTGLMRLLIGRTIAWMLPGLLILAVTGASVVPFTGVRLPGFLGDESAGARVSQALPLFDGWRDQPMIGSGLGASLQGNYVRSVTAPWSFELTYLQMMFQTGVVGLLVLTWAATAPFFYALRTLGRRASDIGRQELVVAGLAGLAGLFVASATNPYLLSAFGMLCVALGFALVELGVRTPPVSPARGLRGLPVVAVVMALMVVLATLEFASERL